jgi:hypothetical protein
MKNRDSLAQPLTFCDFWVIKKRTSGGGESNGVQTGGVIGANSAAVIQNIGSVTYAVRMTSRFAAARLVTRD